jgi:hypothetical protein
MGKCHYGHGVGGKSHLLETACWNASEQAGVDTKVEQCLKSQPCQSLPDVEPTSHRFEQVEMSCGGSRRRMLGHRSRNTGVVMAKTAKLRAWTKDDVRELKALARQKTPVAKIAKSLKRTPGATQRKASSLGVSLDSRG